MIPIDMRDFRLFVRECIKLGQADELIDILTEENVIPQGELANEVWKLYEKYHSHLATHVIEFGDELKDLLGKYQKGGAEWSV